MLKFEWDEKKNESNRKKHGVWFEEAQQIFDDPYALRFDDLGHNEERFILLGRSASLRVLVVVFCEREDGDILRIISARKGTKKEEKMYEKGI